MTDTNEEFELEGGFFEESGDDVAEIPDDPFGFGNDYWQVRIAEIKSPKVTQSGDKFGMMIKWYVDSPKYQEHWVGDPEKGLGNGNWTQLPVPKVLQKQGVPWDPKNNQQHEQVRIAFKNLLLNLGFSVDEMPKVGPAQMVHRGMLTKIKPKQDENGFWQFRFQAPKPLASGDGASEFAQPKTGTSNGSGKSDADLLNDELNGA